MASHANQSDSSPARAASCLNIVRYHARVTIGATGAPTIAKNSDPGITISRSAAGAYSVTYPKGKTAFPNVQLLSPAKTVVTSPLLTNSATAGTCTLKTLGGTNAAADTDPASGDEIHLTIDVER